MTSARRRGPQATVVRPAGAEELELWDRYRSSRDDAFRNELVLAYRDVVETAIRRLPHTVRDFWEQGDLVSFGTLGLIATIERWADDADDSTFRRYAVVRVRGAIFDQIRRLDWVPRQTRHRLTVFRTRYEELTSERGRAATVAEVQESLGLSNHHLDDVLRGAHVGQLLHLGHVADDGEGTSPEEYCATTDNPEDQVVSRLEYERLLSAMHRLPEPDRTVVRLSLVEGIRHVEIARRFDRSDTWVSQIRTRALEQLRRALLETEELSDKAAS